MSNEILLFTTVLAQNITFVIYVNAVFDYKYNRKITNIILFIFLTLLYLATTSIINIKPLKLILITTCQILAYKKISNNTWWETIKKSIIFVLLGMISELICDTIYYLISYFNHSRLDIYNASEFDTLRVLSSCFFLSLFMSIILIYILNYKRVLKKIKRKLIIILILIPLVVTFIHCIIYSYNIDTFTNLTLWFVCISTLIFTVLPPAIYSLMLEVEKYSKKEHELELLKQKETMKLEYYKMMQLKEEEIRKINHDIKNNLQVIYSLKNEEEKAKLIEKIDNNLKKHELIKYSKNAIENIILNIKINEAKKKGIEVEVALKNSLNFIDDLDISNLFSNILDNAIENIDSKNKSIKLSIYKKMNYVIVKCSNTVDTKKVKLDKGKEHGHGLKIINGIAKKYNGEVRINQDEEEYEITVLLAED